MSTLDDLLALVAARHVRAYKMNDVPPKPAYPYAVVGLGSPDKIARTSDGAAGNLNRATIQFFGDNADGLLDASTKADLDGVHLGGADGLLITRELSTPPYRDPDAQGVLNVLHTYRF